MKETTITITIPDGYDDIDKKALAEGKISFVKAKPIPWRKTKHNISGFYVTDNSDIRPLDYVCDNIVNKNLFANEKQAKSMLAMAQLSQIIQNDERFGGPITDEEWRNESMEKYVIVRSSSELRRDYLFKHYHFLALHTEEQRDLFPKENEDLIKQYYMLD